MNIYRFTGTVTVSISTRVKASSREEALRIAKERDLQTICHQCSGVDDREEWALSGGELDGTVEIDPGEAHPGDEIDYGDDEDEDEDEDD